MRELLALLDNAISYQMNYFGIICSLWIKPTHSLIIIINYDDVYYFIALESFCFN